MPAIGACTLVRYYAAEFVQAGGVAAVVGEEVGGDEFVEVFFGGEDGGGLLGFEFGVGFVDGFGFGGGGVGFGGFRG